MVIVVAQESVCVCIFPAVVGNKNPLIPQKLLCLHSYKKKREERVKKDNRKV